MRLQQEYRSYSGCNRRTASTDFSSHRVFGGTWIVVACRGQSESIQVGLEWGLDSNDGDRASDCSQLSCSQVKLLACKLILFHAMPSSRVSQVARSPSPGSAHMYARCTQYKQHSARTHTRHACTRSARAVHAQCTHARTLRLPSLT